jgi:hypothetical protein
LITKTYRFQEKEKLAVCFEDTDRNEKLERDSLTISKIRKGENCKRNNRWIHSKGKNMQGAKTSPAVK